MSAAAGAVLTLLLAATAVPPSPTAAEKPTGDRVILFLIDNSASLPPLDPYEKRVKALEKMFTFLEGQPYRVILFGGRSEVFVDDISQYRNNGQWTDFYFAFVKARELMAEYPKGTEFRTVLLTDAIVDPGPKDWEDMNVPQGVDLKAHNIAKTIELIAEMGQPLYVVLIGDIPPEGVGLGGGEQAPTLILDMVRAANGPRAAPFAQTVAGFFGDNGLLLRKFVYRVTPSEGLKAVEPVVRKVTSTATPVVELQFLTLAVLPLSLFLFLLLGVLVRSFPGPGDLEVAELSLGVPLHLGVDVMHKTFGGLAMTGLSAVKDAREAAGTLLYQAPALDLTGKGLETDGLEPTGRKLLGAALDSMRADLEDLSSSGAREEKIFVLNLDYMAKNMEAKDAERVLLIPIPERRKLNPLDFLRAKAHLLSDEPLRQRLIEPRVIFSSYGKGADRKELLSGAEVRIGRYGFLVKDVARGGRRDARLVLYYDRVPSLFGLKTILPDVFQKLFRFRRSSQRYVS